jgi:O-antigen/teichoic acid export membrane protein
LALIAYNVVVELFTALRLQRIASGLVLFNVTWFAASGVVLLSFRPEASSVILAFGSAAGLTVMASLFWLWRCWQTTPVSGPPPAHAAFWPKVLYFTGWLWLTNWLANLFAIADRYMLVHFSGLPNDDALAVVGQYHSARVMPLLLLGVAAMLASVVTPHLSRDWEAGQRQTVCERLKLFWKTLGFALSAAGVLFLFCAPLLFEFAFAGKFAGGQAVLSWTLMTAIWAGLICIVQIYVLCAEQPRISTLAFAMGLPLNIFLNFLLLPRWGLLGAVVSTSISHFVVLACIVGYIGRQGFRVDAGAVLATLLPAVLCLGPWGGLAALAAAVLIAITTDIVITPEEKRRLVLFTTQFLEKTRIRGQRRTVVSPVTD